MFFRTERLVIYCSSINPIGAEIRIEKMSSSGFMIDRTAYYFGRKSTMFIAKHFGERFPFYYVFEYPKSGGTWLTKMLADYLGLPFAGPTKLPIGFKCVLHSHDTYHPNLKRVVYLARDGRDVMVSFYFHKIRVAKENPAVAKWLANALGENYDPEDVKYNMPRFIEHEMQHPTYTKTNWPTYVESWWGKPGVTCVRYEDLLTNGTDTIEKILHGIGIDAIQRERIAETYRHFEFKNMAGRAQGTENRESFLRKGVSGDWKNYFSRQAAEVFDGFAGDVLKRAGYAHGRGWIEEIQ